VHRDATGICILVVLARRRWAGHVEFQPAGRHELPPVSGQRGCVDLRCRQPAAVPAERRDGHQHRSDGEHVYDDDIGVDGSPDKPDHVTEYHTLAEVDRYDAGNSQCREMGNGPNDDLAWHCRQASVGPDFESAFIGADDLCGGYRRAGYQRRLESQDR